MEDVSDVRAVCFRALHELAVTPPLEVVVVEVPAGASWA